MATLCGERLVGLRLFEQVKRRCVVEILLLLEEGLPDMVVGQVPEVFGGKGQRIHRPKLWMARLDHLLFYSPHEAAPVCPSPAARRRLDLGTRKRLRFKVLEQVYYIQAEVSSRERRGDDQRSPELSVVLVNGF